MPSMNRIDLCGAVLVFTLKLLDMKKHYILTGLVLLAASQGFAQVKIGAAGAPDPSASLEVTSGAAHNKGLLLPRLTDGERNAMTNPASGLLIFNTSANSVQVNIGTSLLPFWVTASATATATAWNITGNTNINPATNFLGTTDNQPLSIRTNNAEAIRVTADGKVGIGIAAPAVKLHILDTGAVALRVVSATNDNTRITFGNHLHGIMRNLTHSGGINNDVALFTGSGGVGASIYLSANPTAADNVLLDQFALKSTGNVGIGIKDPTSKLHVNGGGLTITNNGAIPSSAINILSDNGGLLNPDNVSITTYGPSNAIFGVSAARGTLAAPQNSQAGDNTGNVYFAPRVNGAFAALSGMTSTYVGDGTTNKSMLRFLTSGTVAMTIDSSGSVGIGTTAPKVKLQVNGGIVLRNDVNIAHGNGAFFTWSTVRSGIGETEFINYRGTGSGGFRFYDVNPGGSVDTAVFNTNNIAFIAPGTGAYSNVSDMRVKTNVNIINDGLQKVMAMRPVSYDFHSGRTIKDGVVKFTENDQVVKTIGFLAQELAKVVPEAVIIPKDPSNELYNVSYATVIPVLTKAIQEQQAEIEQLKAALAVSKADNAALKADVSKISALAERMQQLEASLGTKAAGNTTVSK